MPGRKVFIASAVIASAFAVCAPAQASTFVGNGTQTIVNGTGAFSDAQIGVGPFTDTITFNVPSAGISDVGVIYFEYFGGITGLSAIFNGTPITLGPVPIGNNFTALGGSLGAGVIAGPQTLVIKGMSGGFGSYSGNVVFSAVPEAATWLMLIAGIGFTGFSLRNRKAQTKVSYAF